MMDFPEHIANSLKLANNNSMDLKTSEILANNEPVLNGLKCDRVKLGLPPEDDSLKSNGKETSPSLETEDDESDSESSGDESVSSAPLQIDIKNEEEPMDTNTEEDEEVVNPDPELDPELSDGDGESFEGKIVYNPDGSAYIIDEPDCELSDSDSIVPQQEGCIVDHKGVVNSQNPAYPQIASALYIHRNPSFYNSAVHQSNTAMSDAPVMHSYKVFDAKSRDDDRASPDIKLPASAALSAPTRPILMCFICKLSFNYTRSFSMHATTEHNMSLSQEERDLLAQDNVSAIIQALGVEKQPLMSFLEPSLTSVIKEENAKSNSSNENLTGYNPSESPSFQTPQFSMRDSLKSAISPTIPTSPMTMSLTSPTSGLSLLQRQAFTFTRGMCEDHPQGKQQGVECPKCDMILSSTRSLGGHMTMMHSRNSCKTLKCPKCNWHYKYQETLEIHMKEKHPENETQCVYCLANQAHPRLARGESYQCGYKPYRCEICNYSTTTKGNLSIHMQSDKHINNMQDLQNSGGSPSDHIKMPGQQSAQPPPQSPTPVLSPHEPTVSASTTSSTNAAKQTPQRQDSKTKPKPSWRCDVCNYETNVARNLRIHMTSEKHTHNMMVLQQNVKHMQRDMQLQMNQMALFGQDPTLLGLPSPLTPTGLSSFPYDPSMFMSPLPGMETPGPIDLSKDGGELGNQDPSSQTVTPLEMKLVANEPTKIFHCAVCNAYSTNSLDDLNTHMQKDRSTQRDPEHVMITGGNYICNLCSYKTNLKANFQLHCKTDKHLQRLQLVNHIQEGGPSNEWRLKYVNLSNPVQLRCSACDYYTNTIHKLQVHEQSAKHELSSQLFLFLQKHEVLVKSDTKYYYCALCNLASRTKLNLIQHVRSSKHLRKISIWQMQQREQGKEDEADTFDFFKVREYAEDDIIKFDEEEEELADDSSNPSPQGPNDEENTGTSHNPSHQVSGCPLCTEKFTDKDGLQKHLFSTHNVTAEGMQRLLVMVETDPPESSSRTGSPATKVASSPLLTPDSDTEAKCRDEAMNMDTEGSEDLVDPSEERYRCQMCTKTFLTIDSLYAHQNELGHLELKQTPRGPGYLCWKKGCNQYFKTANSLQIHFREIHAKRQNVAVSERHVYKYRCNQCSLAFKTLEKLQTHSQYHIIRAATKCNICDRSFRSIPALHRHYEASHFDSMSEAEIEQVRSMMVLPGNLEANYLENSEDSVDDTQESSVAIKEEDSQSQESTESSGVDQSDSTYKEQQFLDDYINSQTMAEDNFNDPIRKYRCHRCKVAFTKQSYLSAHNRTLLHRKGEKLSYPMEKYLDPNRPFKCDTCKESFTQKNILMVHYNSVSHLHKQRQVSLPGTSSPTPIITTANPMTSSTSVMPQPQQSPIVMTSSESTSDPKPYKCNICKVAYSQITTLDIHMRSVLHQTRASRITELASTGQIDLLQPLVEYPSKTGTSITTTPEPVKKVTPTPTSTPVQQSPKQSAPVSLITGLTVPKTEAPPSKPSTPLGTPVMNPFDAQIQAMLMQSTPAMHMCNRCNSMFVTEEVLQQHQQLYCFFSAPGVPATRMPNYMTSRRKLQVHKNLLENFGFECVMQFNELNQALLAERRKRRLEKAEEKNVEIVKKEPVVEEESSEKENEKKVDIPEINKCVCPICDKKFTSIWVLKCHREEVHNDVVPQSIVENYGHIVAEDMNKKFSAMEDEKERERERREKSAALTITTTQSSEIPESRSEPATPVTPMTPTPASLDAATAQMLQMSMLGMMPMFYPPSMQMAMNLQPPMFPMMLPPMSPAPFPSPSNSAAADTKSSSQPQSQPSQPPTPTLQAPPTTTSGGEKRARTRINDEQLKVLRAHFDINNSPSEAQIIGMSEKTGLPQKVIKHWFRNTLFKERQRNKDSPYNFDNPPSTSIDLEEYQKTGKLPPIEEDERMERPKVPPIIVKKEKLESVSASIDEDLNEDSNMSATSSVVNSLPPTPTTPFSPYASYAGFPSTSTPVSAASNDSFESQQAAYMARSARRANRTRFTDFQIKTLQDYFDQNAYPKDDDLDHLSKLLGLNPRVIVVWFQNARQKARKVYENQPPENGDGTRYTRTQSLNYQCKKCQTVFQRYYDLIKHQKKMCYQNEDIPLPFKIEDDSGSSVGSNCEGAPEKDAAKETLQQAAQMLSPTKELPKVEKQTPEKEKSEEKRQTYRCDKCHSTFYRYDLWFEHQKVHTMNPGLFPNFAPDGAFALLQNVAKQPEPESPEQSSPGKRPLSGSDDEDYDRSDESMHKRLRTTILPEQLDYLYQKYQQDSNPSRKQLEKISNDVGLKKRVVQVWFQNTRARERKGQFRAHTQLIHKRCPFCRALFRNRSALESHLAMKHPEEWTKGDINIDNIPDASQDESSPSTPLPPNIPGLSPGPMAGLDMNKLMAAQYAMQPFLPFIPPMPTVNDPVQDQLKKIYEDSLKKYLEELSATGSGEAPKQARTLPDKHAPSTSSERPTAGEIPLDLSKPIRVKTEMDHHPEGPITDISERSIDDLNSSRASFEDSKSELNSEDGDSFLNGSPTSPGGTHRLPAKRYRTQMTNVQIKIMKHIFQDYKTPTMTECEMLGKDIGLQKRVVQVWFQNARAKEKKAKLNYQKTYGTEPESPRPPEECKLCKFPYSHRYTIQDHVFTQKHVQAVRKFLSNNDNDCVVSPDAALVRQMEAARTQKDWEQKSLTPHPHLAQLRAMGLQAASDNNGGSSAKKEDTEQTSRKEHKKETKPQAKKDSTSDNVHNPQLMSPFGGFFPGGMDPTTMALLPFMYPGMPGMFPGMGGMTGMGGMAGVGGMAGMGMPFMPPGMFPGAESMFQYDPTTFGTPLTLLQIPQQAIHDVSLRLAEQHSTSAQYTQDSKSLAELKSLVSEKDYKCAAENTVDVGFVCKKCTMVFPIREACVSHQKMQCFVGKSADDKAMVKLEQIQYKCSACGENFNTLQEYKLHCATDVHKSRVTKHNGHGSAGADNDEPPAKKIKSETKS